MPGNVDALLDAEDREAAAVRSVLQLRQRVERGHDQVVDVGLRQLAIVESLADQRGGLRAGVVAMPCASMLRRIGHQVRHHFMHGGAFLGVFGGSVCGGRQLQRGLIACRGSSVVSPRVLPPTIDECFAIMCILFVTRMVVSVLAGGARRAD